MNRLNQVELAGECAEAEISVGWWSSLRESLIERAGSRAGVLFALFVTGFTTFLNMYSTQPMLPWFRQVFHATELQVSLTVSSTVLAVAIIAPLVGVMADSIGRKRVIVAAMLGVAIPTILGATSTSLNQLVVWRFLQGLFVPGIIAVAMAYISEESPARLVGSTMATYVSGTVVGGFSGRFLGGIISHHWGWRVAFVALGVATLAGALAALWLLPRSTKFVRQRNGLASLKAMGEHVKNPQLLATCAVGFNVLFSLVGTFTYVNFYLADRPFYLGATALASIFAVYLIGAVVTPYAGKLIDRIGYRRAVMCSAGVAGFGILLTLVHSVPVIIAGLAIGATGSFASQAAASGHVGVAAGKARSSAAGLYVCLYYLGGCMGSVLPGFFWNQAGWVGCVAIMVVMQGVTATIANKLWRE